MRTFDLDPSQIGADFQRDAAARETSLGQDCASSASGLECLQIRHNIRELIRIEPELRHRRMVGDNTFGQAAAQALDRELEMQCAERGRDGERAVADLVDGVALRAMNAHEGQAPLRRRRLGENGAVYQ